MRTKRILAILCILTLAAAAPLAAQARTKKEGGRPAPSPAGTAASSACAEAAKKLQQAPPAERPAAAMAAMDKRCRPLPEALWTALRDGVWPDKLPLSAVDRDTLLVLAERNGYSEADTMAVALIERGRWPDGSELSLNTGAELIRFLGPTLTTYRVRLLLDVFEQKPSDFVRLAVLQALSESKLDEALLPALEAYWEGQGVMQQMAFRTISGQVEKTPDGTLARLVRKLPQGPLLNWAARMAKSHPSAPVDLAKKARGLE
jgi:hypothetical protein